MKEQSYQEKHCIIAGKNAKEATNIKATEGRPRTPEEQCFDAPFFLIVYANLKLLINILPTEGSVAFSVMGAMGRFSLESQTSEESEICCLSFMLSGILVTQQPLL